MDDTTNNISEYMLHSCTSRRGGTVWIRFLSTMVLLIAITPKHTNGYTMLQQLRPLSQQYQQHLSNIRRESFRNTGMLALQGTEDGNNAVASAVPTNTMITLDGQEIRQEITAMNNIIFVKVKEALSTTMGGIVLPDQSKQRPTEGIVVACGPGKIHPHTGKRITNPISVGMNVVYGQYDGKAVMYNDEECQIIRDDNVLLAYPGGNAMMTIDNVTPIRDYVLVELISPTKSDASDDDNTIATNSGIVIAASVLKDNLPCEGRVVKVGEGRQLPDGVHFSASPVQVNDLIKFKEYAGNDILMNDGKQYSVVKMVDILCTYKNE